MEDLLRYGGALPTTLAQCDPRGGTCDFEYVGGTTYRCTTHPGAIHTCGAKCNLKTQTTLGYVCPISRRYYGRAVCTSVFDKNGNEEYDHTFEPIEVSEDGLLYSGGSECNRKTKGTKGTSEKDQRNQRTGGGGDDNRNKRARGETAFRPTISVEADDGSKLVLPAIKTRKCKPLAAASIESVLKRLLIEHVSEYTHELVRLHEFVADQGLSPERYVLGTLYFLSEGFSMGANDRSGPSCEVNAWLGALLPHPNDLKLRGLQCGNVGKGMEAWRRCILTSCASDSTRTPDSPVGVSDYPGSNPRKTNRPTFRNHKQILEQHTNFTTRRSKCPVVML